MILKETTSKPIDRIAIGEEKKFSIKASAKAFKILSSTIYPDPIAAPIRELGTNAIDSHNDAGVNEPFLVHLPNSMEPFFSIRDYGTGISEEDIGSVYCTYFESTRTSSNNFTGGFGLGSKTPFCYSDTFTVTSICNGRKMLYTAFLEDGEPKIAKFADEPSDERNGLEVSFPVKSEDIYKFQSTAQRIYSRFSRKPKVVGCADFKMDEIEYSITGNGWGIRKNDQSGGYYGRNSYAIMGSILYPIDQYKLSGMTAEESALLESGVDLNFDVGVLQPTVSREHLQYDNDSIAQIKKNLSVACEEIKEIFKEKISVAKNLWEAKIIYTKLVEDSDSGLSWKMRDILKNMDIKYKGKSTRENLNLGTIYSKYCVENKIADDKKEKYIYQEYRLNGNARCKSSYEILIQARQNIVFYIDDLAKGAERRIRQFVKNNPGKRLVLFNPNIRNDTKLFKKIIEEIGIDDTYLNFTSSLDKVVYAKRSPEEKSEIKLPVFTPYSTNHVSYNWNMEDFDVEDIEENTYYYLDLTGYIPDEISIDNLFILHSTLESVTKKEFTLIGLRSEKSKKFKEQDNFINFLEYAKETITDQLKTNSMEQSFSNYIHYSDFIAKNNNRPEMAISPSELDVDCYAREYLETVRSMKADYEKFSKSDWYSRLRNLASGYGVKLDTKTPDHDLFEARKNLVKKYPILKCIYSSNDNWRMESPHEWKQTVISYLNTEKK